MAEKAPEKLLDWTLKTPPFLNLSITQSWEILKRHIHTHTHQCTHFILFVKAFVRIMRINEKKKIININITLTEAISRDTSPYLRINRPRRAAAFVLPPAHLNGASTVHSTSFPLAPQVLFRHARPRPAIEVELMASKRSPWKHLGERHSRVGRDDTKGDGFRRRAICCRCEQKVKLPCLVERKGDV